MANPAPTAREIFGQGYSDRATLFTIGAKYRDPATGATGAAARAPGSRTATVARS